MFWEEDNLGGHSPRMPPWLRACDEGSGWRFYF